MSEEGSCIEDEAATSLYSESLVAMDIDTMTQKVWDVLVSMVEKDKIEKYTEMLKDYYYVEHIDDLYCGKYVRWFSKENPSKLFLGGIVVSIEEESPEIHRIWIQNRYHSIVIQYIFEKAITFQKLSDDKKMILLLMKSPP